jgi:type II secretory pathway pseudopilin PulG
MKPFNNAGFTIIETMLFLGITGLLVVGVLAGAGTSINVQRYRDSVTSLQSILQQQYSDVMNVSNDSPINSCNAATNIARGQSGCVVLGRYITTLNSRRLIMKNVIGVIPASEDATATLNDISVFLGSADGAQPGYNIQVIDTNSQVYDVEWGSSLVDTAINKNVPLKFSMLILRSPVSGAVRTFVAPNATNQEAVIADKDIATLVNQAALKQKISVCVDSNGFFIGGKSAVVITANTTSI